MTACARVVRLARWLFYLTVPARTCLVGMIPPMVIVTRSPADHSVQSSQVMLTVSTKNAPGERGARVGDCVIYTHQADQAGSTSNGFGGDVPLEML